MFKTLFISYLLVQGSAFGADFIADPKEVLEQVRKNPKKYYQEIKSVTFCGESLQGEILEDARLENAEFVFSSFANASLARANLEGAKFSSCNMSNANLSNAKSSNAVFFDVNFIGADLSRGDFRNSVFTNVNFFGTKLRKTNFSGATFNRVICQRPAKVSKEASLRGCEYFEKLRDLCGDLKVPEVVDSEVPEVLDLKVPDYDPSSLKVAKRATLGSIGKKNSMGSIGKKNSPGSIGKKNSFGSIGRGSDGSPSPKSRKSISRNISNSRGERTEKPKKELSIISPNFFDNKDIAD